MPIRKADVAYFFACCERALLADPDNPRVIGALDILDQAVTAAYDGRWRRIPQLAHLPTEIGEAYARAHLCCDPEAIAESRALPRPVTAASPGA